MSTEPVFAGTFVPTQTVLRCEHAIAQRSTPIGNK